MQKKITMRTVTFPTGYYDLHPDTGLNYEMNRFSGVDPGMISRIREAAPRIKNYDDYTREFLALSEKAEKENNTLYAACFLRSAEFFMWHTDPRKKDSRLRYLSLIRESYAIGEEYRHLIPYEKTKITAYRFTPESPKGVIVLFGGFDSYIEDLFPILLYFFQEGFDIIGFEGPGQGACLEDYHVPLTPDWHKPCSAVLDFFNLSDVTLIGYSLGGCMVVRAAALEPRVSRVICNDVLADFYQVILAGRSRMVAGAISFLSAAKLSFLYNFIMNRLMKKNLTLRWGNTQGMLVSQTKSPFAFLQFARKMETASLSHLVKQDVLLMAGNRDHFVPLNQFFKQMGNLTNARSVTGRIFTEQETAQSHCHIGNTGLSLRFICNWIRNTGPGAG